MGKTNIFKCVSGQIKRVFRRCFYFFCTRTEENFVLFWLRKYLVGIQ